MVETNPNSESEGQPGKTRTWWHPLLVRMIDWSLADAYEVRAEVNVGRMPLRVDIVLIERGDGDLPERARRLLAAIAERLNLFTLIEFKSPSDALESGDLDYLLGCTRLFRAQQEIPIKGQDITLIVLAPTFNAAFREDLRLDDWTSIEESPGIHRIEGPTFETWMIETDVVSGLDEPILTLFSRVFQRDRRRIIELMKEGGYYRLLQYLIQQLNQFRHKGKEFAMQHADTETMDATFEELRLQIIEASSPEDRLRGLAPEEVLRAMSPEQLAEGLSSVKNLSAEQIVELRKLLGQSDS